jgi:tetrapyrrole methylase family protein/MazG family protein
MEDPKLEDKSFLIDNLLKLIASLRGPDGCPWDRKQTPRSMLVYLLEEMYELADAVETDNSEDICEELGDVLFHIFFMARMFEETGQFSIHDVARVSTEKMIRRHPHVFGAHRVESPDDIIQNWQKIKMSEKNMTANISVLDSIPAKIPALMRAFMVFDRTAKAGFDWNRIEDNLEKLERKIAELKTSLCGKTKTVAAEEIGDLLLILVNVARFAKIHPETALLGSLKRFEKRFKMMEKRLADSGRGLEDVSQIERNQIWEKQRSE